MKKILFIAISTFIINGCSDQLKIDYSKVEQDVFVAGELKVISNSFVQATVSVSEIRTVMELIDSSDFDTGIADAIVSIKIGPDIFNLGPYSYIYSAKYPDGVFYRDSLPYLPDSAYYLKVTLPDNRELTSSATMPNITLNVTEDDTIILQIDSLYDDSVWPLSDSYPFNSEICVLPLIGDALITQFEEDEIEGYSVPELIILNVDDSGIRTWGKMTNDQVRLSVYCENPSQIFHEQYYQGVLIFGPCSYGYIINNRYRRTEKYGANLAELGTNITGGYGFFGISPYSVLKYVRVKVIW